MKKFLLLSLVGFTLFSCGMHKINSDYYKWSEGIDFKINNIINVALKEGSGNNRNYTYIASKGTKFKRANFTYRNNTNKTQEIDFSKLYLIDRLNRKYRVSTALQQLKVYGGNATEKLIREIKPNKEVKFMVDFTPPFPKDEVITRLLIDENDSETISKNAKIINLAEAG